MLSVLCQKQPVTNHSAVQSHLFIPILVINTITLLFWGYFLMKFSVDVAVFKKAPPVPPSQAQAAIVEAFKDEDYFASLKRLFLNNNFILLMVTYGE